MIGDRDWLIKAGKQTVVEVSETLNKYKHFGNRDDLIHLRGQAKWLVRFVEDLMEVDK